jgi:phosphate transport system substrate-binding protein
MNFSRKATSTTTIGLVVVLIVVIVGAGAYIALGAGGKGATTVTQTSTATSTVSATSTTGPAVTINGGGSSLVTPVMSIWSFTYGQLGNVNVNYQTEGSSAGIAAILAGTVNFGASDAPLQPAQYAEVPSGSTLLTIPETASAVIPAYNVPGISSSVHLNFTGGVLAEIFLGNISMWNDPALVALNPGVTLPAEPISVVHRSDGSGTMFAFTNYLSDSSAYWKTHVGTGTLPNWPTGKGCLHNAGVASCISGTPYSIGPLEIAYQIQNPGAIAQGTVENAAGNFILANLTNIAESLNAGATGLPAGSGNWSAVSIVNNIYNDTTAKYVYPITTFTYIMVYENMGAAAAHSTLSQATATVNFLWWVVNSGQAAGSGIGYPPLPSAVITLDDATINSINYNGTPIHTGS